MQSQILGGQEQLAAETPKKPLRIAADGTERPGFSPAEVLQRKQQRG
jgi:hypothetical protein